MILGIVEKYTFGSAGNNEGMSEIVSGEWMCFTDCWRKHFRFVEEHSLVEGMKEIYPIYKILGGNTLYKH